jgi:hypothetical protein
LYIYFQFIFIAKRSISSKYKGINNGSNLPQNKTVEAQSKREELQQRIEETRRTLQNVYYYN